MRPTELLTNTLELLQVCLILLLVLDFLADAFEDSDRGRVVVDTSGCTEGSLDDRG